MERIISLYERALTGEKMEEKTFDMRKLPATLKELVKKYEITRKPEESIPTDLNMARRTFDAAIDLLLELGIYCRDTKRIIALTKDDIESALNNVQQPVIMGENNEAFEYYSRNLEDTRRPRISAGPNGAPISEEHFLKIMTSYALEPVDGVHTGSLQSLFGRKIRAGTPIEYLACKYEVIWTREALKRAQKPGLSITGPMSGVTSEAQNGVDFEGGLRPGDRHLICMLNELKVDWAIFNKLIHCFNLGNSVDVDQGGPIIGGYTGGLESSAIAGVAEMILGYILSSPKLVSLDAHNLLWGWSHSGAIWTNAMVPLAFQSAGIPAVLGIYLVGAAGPCTEMLCNEIAAQGIAYTATGTSFFSGPGGCNIAKKDYFSGMESRILYETCKAASGITLKDANEIVRTLTDQYDKKLEKNDIPEGKCFTECYDVEKMKPFAEYTDIWDKKKSELAKYNLQF